MSSDDQVAELIAACGRPVEGTAFAASELTQAAAEGRVMTSWMSSSMGDRTYGAAFAPIVGAHHDGEGLTVFRLPIPEHLRGPLYGGDSEVNLHDTSAGDPESLTLTSVIPTELLAALAATPHDQATRLVIADLLQGMGDPRGELIALELALARVDRRDLQQRSRIEGRITRLAGDARALWRTELGLTRHVCQMRGGFIEAVTISKGSGGLAAIEGALGLSPITGLEVAGEEALASVLAHPIAARLEALQLEKCAGDAAFWRRLAALKLRRLELRAGPISLLLLTSLLDGPLKESLEELVVYSLAEESERLLVTGTRLTKIRPLTPPKRGVRASVR